MFSNNESTIKFAHEWIIDHFARENHPFPGPLLSKQFSPPVSNLLNFQFQLYPNGVDDSCREHLSIGILCDEVSSELTTKLNCKLKICILDENEQACHTKIMKNLNLLQNCKSALKQFIDHDSLFKSSYLQNGRLTLKFWLKLSLDSCTLFFAKNGQLKLKHNGPEYPIVAQSYLNGAAKLVKLEYKWIIENFDKLFESGKSLFIESKCFPDSKNDQKLKLRLFPIRSDSDDSSIFSIEMYNESDKTNFLVNSKIKILSDVKLTNESTDLILPGSGKIYPEFKLENSELPKNCLTIHCELCYTIASKQTGEIDEVVNREETLNKLESNLDAATVKAHFTQHKWPIEGFGNFEKSICFPSKFKLEFEKCQITVELKENYHDTMFLSLFFNVSSCSIDIAKTQYRASILSQDGERCCSKVKQDFSIYQKGNFGFDKFIHKSQLAHLIKNQLTTCNLTFLFEFWMSQDLEENSNKQQKCESDSNSAVTITLTNSIFNFESNPVVTGNISLGTVGTHVAEQVREKLLPGKP